MVVIFDAGERESQIKSMAMTVTFYFNFLSINLQRNLFAFKNAKGQLTSDIFVTL